MDYVDGFVAAVPTAGREAYISFAGKMAGLFREYGALRVVETWGDDVPEGVVTSFPLAVQRKDDETVVFSWVVWPSKQVRDAGWKSLSDDPRMSDQQMPFDGKRMIYGGFQSFLAV
jgi:uncharacterized protein YbaA (DUF1428 family)